MYRPRSSERTVRRTGNTKPASRACSDGFGADARSRCSRSNCGSSCTPSPPRTGCICIRVPTASLSQPRMGARSKQLGGTRLFKLKLEQRFGPIQPTPEERAALKPRRRYEKKPLSVQIRRSSTPSTSPRRRTWRPARRRTEQVRAHKERRIEAAMCTVRLRRAALKLAKMPRNTKKLRYRPLANALRDDISEIRRACRREYQDISQKFRRRQWVDWLRHQAGTGNADALAS